MSDQPDYAPAQLARQVAHRLAVAATTADHGAPGTPSGDRTVDDLIADARYTAGVLDGLSLLLPATADPNPTGRPEPAGQPGDTAAALRAHLDQVAAAAGLPAGTPGERIVRVTDEAADEHRDRLARAITTGQRYADRVDTLVAELEQARARIAELGSNGGPASSPTGDDCGDPQCTLGGPHTHAEPPR